METAKIYKIYQFSKSQVLKTYCSQVSFSYVSLPGNNQYYCGISEMNITGTLPPLLLMAKSWSQILRDTSPRHACLGEVSRESASRQSRELIMRSERTTNVQRGGRRESQGRVICRLFKTHLHRKVSFMVVHSHIKVGEKKKYYKSVIQLVLI